MPKVKEATTAKASAKATETAKGAAAATKAAREKVIEAAASSLVKVTAAMKAHVQKANDSQKELCRVLNEAITENGFDQSEARQCLKTAMARVYCDGDESQISPQGNQTVNSLLSRIIRVAFPKDKKAEKETAKCLASDERSFSQTVSAARGDITFAGSEPVGQHGGSRVAGGGKKNAPYEDREQLGNAVAPHISRGFNGEGKLDGYEGGLTIDEIEDTLAEIVAGYREKLEAADEEAAKPARKTKGGKKAAPEADEED